MKTVPFFTGLAAVLSRPAIMFWTLPWLMVLLVAGTVAQKYLGLYVAQKTFFSSFVFWLGPVPLPGGYAAIGVIFVCLLMKFVTESRWSWQRAGIILTHFGALVLLAGGLLTAVTAREGYMTIAEGEETAVVEDYHARVLTVTQDGSPFWTVAYDDLYPDQLLQGPSFSIRIVSAHKNGTPQQRTNPEGDDWMGAAQKVEMIPAAPEIQDEINHGFVNLVVRGTDMDGIYLVTEVMPVYPQFEDDGHVYEVRFGKVQTTLPFSIALKDVEKDSYPGMEMARAYHSILSVEDGGVSWPAEISMNNPLRYRGYTFYQSSYMVTPNGETTVLSVVWNAGRLFPYIASAIISFGLILHLLMSVRGRRAAMILFAVLCAGSAQAADFDMKDFRMIPVLHDGRLKPLETFAVAELQDFSGGQTLDGMNADEWLAELLFDPVNAAARPVFEVRDRILMMMLSLPKQAGSLYTLAQIRQGMSGHAPRIEALLQMPEDKLDAPQKALIDLHHKMSDYMQLMRTFSLVLPLAVAPPASLLTAAERKALATQAPDYMMLRKYEERAVRRVKEIVRKRGENPEKYTEDEKLIAAFAWQLQALSGGSEGNSLFRVIPVSFDHEERVAPWAVLQEGQGSPATAAVMAQWKALGVAWLNDDAAAWATAAENLRGTPSLRFTAEAFYNQVQPFEMALILYVLTAGLLILGHIKNYARLFTIAVAALCFGVIAQAFGLVLRVYILSRPPVGTLYESLLFVSLICVMVGTLVCWKRKDVFSGLAAAVSGALILSVSLYFGAQNGDSLSMLVAVLNTNFWLATHVLIVTAGYGLCILAAMMAHAWLYQVGDRSGLFVTMHRMTLAALLLTAVGTILGGIWADQSWGRFWGWDPKENGALLIVLWIVWLLHGRLAGQLSPALYAAGIAALNMVVALAWFGVNLLSVGLHSYGFTSGIAAGLVTFCAVEVAMIAALYMRRVRHA